MTTPGTSAEDGVRDPAPRRLLPSAVVLVAANLVPVYGAAFLGWSAFLLLMLFWLESVMLGVLNALRMLCIAPADTTQWGWKLFIVPFFCAHYGAFTWMHGFVVFYIFGMLVERGAPFGWGEEERMRLMSPSLKPFVDEIYNPDAILRLIGEQGLWTAVAAVAASHLFSFFWNFIYRGEFRRASVDAQMSMPYARVVVMHVVIMLSLPGVFMLGSPVWALVLLVVLKTWLDLGAHHKEHAEPAAARAA